MADQENNRQEANQEQASRAIDSTKKGLNPKIAILIVVVVLILAAGGYATYQKLNPKNSPTVSTSANSVITPEPTDNSVPSTTPAPSASATANDLSDTQLNKDLQSVDSKLNSLDTETKSADDGLSDVPTDLN